jgi:WhiB family transcriptional regulator, redox-sensing transcriptional regulator
MSSRDESSASVAVTGGHATSRAHQAALQILPAPGRWAEHSLCGQAAWFPDKGRQALIAKRICAACPVRGPCLDYALSGADTWGGITSGIWGGSTPRERAQLRRSRKAAAA